MPRRNRRSGFGYIISTGTAAHPAFKIRWYEGSKRRKRSGFTTRTEAADALARIRTQLGDGTLVAKRRASIGFDAAAQEWLTLHSAPNLRSHADNAERYRVHVKPFFGDCPLAAVTAARILELRAKLQTRGALQPQTINRVMALVRSILRFAVASGHIPASPTDRIGRGKLMLTVAKSKLAPPIERAEDVGRLLAAVEAIGEATHRPVLHPVFSALAYTGLRRGEACGVRWADVDLERALITVRYSYAGPPKSGRDRLVPIPSELLPILQAWKLASPWATDGAALVFPNADGEMQSCNAKLQDVLRKALAAVGLPRIRVHDLRHVFGSHFVMAGGSLFALQRILGHSTPQITSDTYAHLSPAHLAGEADRVSFRAPPPAKVLPLPEKGGVAR